MYCCDCDSNGFVKSILNGGWQKDALVAVVIGAVAAIVVSDIVVAAVTGFVIGAMVESRMHSNRAH